MVNLLKISKPQNLWPCQYFHYTVYMYVCMHACTYVHPVWGVGTCVQFVNTVCVCVWMLYMNSAHPSILLLIGLLCVFLCAVPLCRSKQAEEEGYHYARPPGVWKVNPCKVCTQCLFELHTAEWWWISVGMWLRLYTETCLMQPSVAGRQVVYLVALCN